METLEGLLKRLEQGLARLEEENQKLKGQQNDEVDASDTSILVKELEKQKAILVAQVEKLEAQVEKVREVSVLDKHSAKTAQDNLWKVYYVWYICFLLCNLTVGGSGLLFYLVGLKINVRQRQL